MQRIPGHIRATKFPAVRLAMTDAGAPYTDAALAEHLVQLFPESDPIEVENFMRSLNKFGKSIAPIVRQVGPLLQRAAPGAIQGGMAGMAAGPKGALIGAGVGAVASLLSGPPPSQPPQSAPAQRAPMQQPAMMPVQRMPAQPMPRQLARPQPQPAPATMPMPVQGPAMMSAGGRAAVMQMLALLSRPETMQALSALLMGAAGRQRVRVGSSQVPVAAFANAISEFAADVVEDADPIDVMSDDLFVAEHADHLDMANPHSRADVLLEALMNEAEDTLYQMDFKRHSA